MPLVDRCLGFSVFVCGLPSVSVQFSRPSRVNGERAEHAAYRYVVVVQNIQSAYRTGFCLHAKYF